MARVEPWEYSLRQLLWRWEAIREEAWNHTASMIRWICQPHSKSELTVEEFHPMRGRKCEPVTPEQLRGEAKRLPKRSEAEKKAAWEEFKRKEDALIEEESDDGCE